MPLICCRQLFFATIWLTIAVNFVKSTEISSELRLPKTSFPLHYNIHLKTNIHRKELNFTGNCSILIKVIETTRYLVLHADLNVEKIFLVDVKNELSKEKLNVDLNKANSFLNLTRVNSYNTTKFFEKEQILRLDIEFKGAINKSRYGFQNFTYKNHEGREVMGAFTWLQPTAARSIFPCYDEPVYKARFVLHITHGPNITALSNMPQNGEPIKHDDGTLTTNFKESIVMPTYLLAFLLSDFRYTQLESDDLSFRLFTSDGTDKHKILNNQDWALKTMENLFNVPHELQKLDSSILPTKPDADGIENWGLIFYKFFNTMFAADQYFTDDAYNNNLIFHEICHTWFGNLVTSEWWTYLWLHEGFATYYAYILTDLRWPDDRHLERLRINKCVPQLTSSVEWVLSKIPDAPDMAFDTIQYTKAACIIQMLEHAFKPEIFRNGISMYLKANHFSVVTEDDLFDAIQYAKLIESNAISVPWTFSVHEIMKSWTHNAVFPIITVERDYTKCKSSVIKLRDISKAQLTFWIPLTFATASNPNFENTKVDFFMHTKEVTIDLKSLNITLKPDDWLIVNKQAIGYYTVIYDELNMELLNRTLHENRNSISPLNRAALYANIGNMPVKAEKKKLHNISVLDLELIRSLEHETDATVWLAAGKRFNSMPIYTDLKYKPLISYFKDIIEPHFKRFNSKAKSMRDAVDVIMFKELQMLARSLDIQTALNDQALSAAYLQTLKKYQQEGIGIGYHLLCRVVQNISESDFEDLTEEFSKFEENCHLWLGLQCSPTENMTLIYAKIFYEKFTSCDCIKRSVFGFLVKKSTASYERALEAHANALKSNINCTKETLNYATEYPDYYPQQNVLNLEKKLIDILGERKKTLPMELKRKGETAKWLERWENRKKNTLKQN